MSDPKDVVEKADALLGRYRPGDVPLLTDVIESPTPSPAAPAAPLSEAQLRDLETRITQRVLEAIQPALAQLLEPALGALAEQVKAQAEAFVRAAVANALERELRQLRPPGG